ncbi:uncharacterized protein LOC127737092 [Mytilus californianus]|uniref:uncharacterized protein LOC127737092 n=1 Tax=Mytilus californianus TaxID=6549 RepID=UPI002245664D|nr:uncharacterized protein LOC127737092 [Mytilus californianus]
MSDIDPNNLRVAELRVELKARGLVTKGTKIVLARRLTKALKEGKGESVSCDAILYELSQEQDTSHQRFAETSKDVSATKVTEGKSEEKSEDTRMEESEAELATAKKTKEPEEPELKGKGKQNVEATNIEEDVNVPELQTEEKSQSRNF